MGGGDSKLSFLSYDDAVKRIGETDLQRVRETFKRHSGNTNLLSKPMFFSDLLSELVPPKLCEQVYAKCGGGAKGIAFREVVVILVLITNGTRDEKSRFLFHLASEDGSSVHPKELEDFYYLSEEATAPLPRCVSGAFWKRDKFHYDDFHNWLVSNSDCCSLTRWLLEHQFSLDAVRITNANINESFYASLAKLTKLEEQEVVDLEKRYWSLKGVSPTGRFDLKAFKIHVCPLLPEQFVLGVFNFFDKNADDHVDFKEFVCGIALFCRGTNNERLRACFDIFDIDKDTWLCHEELVLMSEGLCKLMIQYSDEGKEISPAQLMESFDMEEDSKMSLKQFQDWGYSSSLLYEFLLLLSQICHIVFGLCPLHKKEEGMIVRRWIERESIRGLQFGSLYYVLSISWWNTWKKYVSFDVDGVAPVQLINKRHSNANNESWFDEMLSHPNQNSGDSESSIDGSDVLGRDSNHFAAHIESSLKSHNDIHISDRNSTPDSPGNIQNSVLLEQNDNRKITILTGEGGKLKQDVVFIYGKDYQVVPELIWRAFAHWYEADVALPRTVVVDANGEAEIELYPIQIDLYRHTQPPKGSAFNMGALGINNIMSQIYGNLAGNPTSNNNYNNNNSNSNNNYSNSTHNGGPDDQAAVATPKRALQYRACFSRKNTVRQIIDFLAQRLKIDVDDLRLWVMEETIEMELLEEDAKVVGEICSGSKGKFLIEVRNRDLSWPEEMSTLVTTRVFRQRSNTGPLEKGATGLHNLGNTCFMNSAVQCLSNTRPLTRYFSRRLFEYELNKANPLGTKGVLAKRYGDMVVDLWSGIYRSIAPVKLRCTVGSYAPRFNGFQQHDSQEFLSFLLDGLHEDLNRVHDKPYVELKDSAGRPDSEVAHEAWDNHLKRNQSIIVDLFQGQLKSQVRCLHCSHNSVTFDPFTFLSLPLPMESSIHFEIPVFPRDGEQAKKYGLLLPQGSTMKVLKSKLAALCSVSVDRLLLAEICGPAISKFPQEKAKIHQNHAGLILAYEVEHEISTLLTNKEKPGNMCQSNSTSKESLHKIANGGVTISISIAGSLDSSNTSPNPSPGKNTFKKPKNDSNSTTVRLIEVLGKDTPDPLAMNESRKISNCVDWSENPDTDTSGTLSRSVSTDSILNTPLLHCVIVAMHRKMVQNNHYFLSWEKFRPAIFGIPIVLSHHSMTNQELYSIVWRHAKKYTTGITLDLHEPKYPFHLKTVDKNGKYCSQCPWFKFCHGCSIECDDSQFDFCSNVAIDWDPTTLHIHYQHAQERNFIEDASVAECFRRMREPISLDQCLKDFTKEEELGEEETWYCSQCKEHRTIAKKLDIWRLPPVLVVHLKRFLFVNNRWIKSNKLVRFPINTFDPSSYLAERQQQQDHSQQKQKEQLHSNNYATTTCNGAYSLPTRDCTGTDFNNTTSDSGFSSVSSAQDMITTCCVKDHDDHPIDDMNNTTFSCAKSRPNSEPPDGHNDDDKESVISISTITLERPVNGRAPDSNPFEPRSPSPIPEKQMNISQDNDTQRNCVYSLYAISCHSGLMNGGHYTTFARNPNGKWYCYNDSSCKEVESEVIEQESPYMLFFERTDLKCNEYMPDVSELESVNLQPEEEEFEKEVKKYCSLM